MRDLQHKISVLEGELQEASRLRTGLSQERAQVAQEKAQAKEWREKWNTQVSCVSMHTVVKEGKRDLALWCTIRVAYCTAVHAPLLLHFHSQNFKLNLMVDMMALRMAEAEYANSLGPNSVMGTLAESAGKKFGVAV